MKGTSTTFAYFRDLWTVTVRDTEKFSFSSYQLLFGLVNQQIIKNLKQTPLEYVELVDKHFWDLA